MKQHKYEYKKIDNPLFMLKGFLLSKLSVQLVRITSFLIYLLIDESLCCASIYYEGEKMKLIFFSEMLKVRYLAPAYNLAPRFFFSSFSIHVFCQIHSSLGEIIIFFLFRCLVTHTCARFSS